MRAILITTLLLAACNDGRGVGTNDGLDLGFHPDGGVADLNGSTHDGSADTDLALPSFFDAAMNSGPSIGLSFGGCSPDFSANVIVVTNSDSMAVTRSDNPLEGQIQLHLTSSGTVPISTQERVDNGDIINLIDGTTYTNISTADPDPITGTLTINSYDEPAGIADLYFNNVVVENVSTHALCTINGSLKSSGKTF